MFLQDRQRPFGEAASRIALGRSNLRNMISFLPWDRRASAAAAHTRYRLRCCALSVLPDAGMPSPGFQARTAFPDHSRTRPWPATRPHETGNSPPRTFAVPLCLFTHDTKLQCNISRIVPEMLKKIATNSSQCPNGSIVIGPRDLAAVQSALH